MEFIILYLFLGSMYFSIKSIKRELDNIRKNNTTLDNFLKSKRLLPMLAYFLLMILLGFVLTIVYPVDALLGIFDKLEMGKKK